jgi:hypothetical protein
MARRDIQAFRQHLCGKLLEHIGMQGCRPACQLGLLRGFGPTFYAQAAAKVATALERIVDGNLSSQDSRRRAKKPSSRDKVPQHES